VTTIEVRGERGVLETWPELTKWPFTTHKRTYQERDARIVALDQAFGNFLIFRLLAGGDGNQVFSVTAVQTRK